MKTEKEITAGRAWHGPALVFALALGVRIVYLLLFQRTEIWDAMMVDADLYDRWGMRIAQGEWIGEKIFYDPPLYAYFLGVIYRLFGHDYLALRIVQAIIGSAHCVIIFYLATTILDRRAGLVAGIAAAFYMPLVFYDAAVMKAFLSSAIIDAGLLALLVAIKSGKYRWWFLHGICLGLAALLRLNVLGFAFIEMGTFAVLIAVGNRRDGRLKSLAEAAILGLGLAMAIAPAAFHNRHVSGETVLVSSYLGQNLYTGNNPLNTNDNYQRLPFVRANPKYEETDFYREAAGRLRNNELTSRQVSDYWLDQALLYIRAQPGAFVKRLWLRFRLFWNAYEVPDCYSIAFIGKYFMPILRLMPGFGIMAPIALLGLVLTLGRRRQLWPLYVFIFGYMFSVIIFFVFSRYRLSVTGSLIAFAGAGIISIWDMKSRRVLSGVAIAFLIVTAVLVNLPSPLPTPDAEQLRNHATLFWQRGDTEKAFKYYSRAVDDNPSDYETRYFYAHVLRESGKCVDAIREYSIALKIRPNDPNSLAGIGICHDLAENNETAREYYLKALQINMKLSDVRLKLAKLFIGEGDYNSAHKHLVTLRTFDPTNPEADLLLKEVEAQIRRINEEQQ